MAIKKSELYSSLWSSCDELRGGMDASQYKDSLDKLSQGKVFVGHHKRLASEISSVVRAICGRPFEDREEHWFLSDLFFEAFAELNDDRVRLRLSKNLLESMRAAALAGNGLCCNASGKGDSASRCHVHTQLRQIIRRKPLGRER